MDKSPSQDSRQSVGSELARRTVKVVKVVKVVKSVVPKPAPAQLACRQALLSVHPSRSAVTRAPPRPHCRSTPPAPFALPLHSARPLLTRRALLRPLRRPPRPNQPLPSRAVRTRRITPPALSIPAPPLGPPAPGLPSRLARPFRAGAGRAPAGRAPAVRLPAPSPRGLPARAGAQRVEVGNEDVGEQGSRVGAATKDHRGARLRRCRGRGRPSRPAPPRRHGKSGSLRGRDQAALRGTRPSCAERPSTPATEEPMPTRSAGAGRAVGRGMRLEARHCSRDSFRGRFGPRRKERRHRRSGWWTKALSLRGGWWRARLLDTTRNVAASLRGLES